MKINLLFFCYFFLFSGTRYGTDYAEICGSLPHIFAQKIQTVRISREGILGILRSTRRLVLYILCNIMYSTERTLYSIDI